MKIIWCMAPKIQSVTNRIFCHFGPFFALLHPQQPGKSKFQRNEKIDSLEILSFYPMWQIEFFVILEHFLHSYHPINPKNQNFERKKKTKPPGDIIILHMCTINDNHMMYDSWDMECDTEFFVILDRFFPFYPSNNQKNQNFEKMKKKTWRYYHFTQVYHKW